MADRGTFDITEMLDDIELLLLIIDLVEPSLSRPLPKGIIMLRDNVRRRLEAARRLLDK